MVVGCPGGHRLFEIYEGESYYWLCLSRMKRGLGVWWGMIKADGRAGYSKNDHVAIWSVYSLSVRRS